MNGAAEKEGKQTVDTEQRNGKKTIGILGGMGPLATADLYRKIITLTQAECDRDHIRIYIDSNSAIPDRTEAILHGGRSPIPEMTSALKNLELCGADCIIMPCNTAHYFLPALQEKTDIPFLNMLQITAECCALRFPGKKAGILATDGTVRTGLYDRALETAGVAYLHPETKLQQTVMHLIYDVVKASRPILPERTVWAELLEAFRAQGADYFILGCTELPVLADTLDAEGPFVDPTEELAKAAIRFCGYRVTDQTGG